MAGNGKKRTRKRNEKKHEARPKHQECLNNVSRLL